MRIALLHYSFPPVVGGVEGVMEEHAGLFAAAGHEVTVFAGTAGPDDRPAERMQIAPMERSQFRVELIAGLEAVSNPAGERREEGAAALVENLHVRLAAQDLIFLHNVCTMPFNLALTEALWRLADSLPSVRFIAWVHDVAAANPDYDIPVEPPWTLLRDSHPRLEYVSVSELRLRELCGAIGLPRSRCCVIPNGIDVCGRLGLPPSLQRRAESGRWLEREILLFHPARLLRRKNVECSLEVVTALRAAGRDAALLVSAAPDPHQAVSGNYAAGLRRLRDALGLAEHVDFLGDALDLTNAGVDALYRLADAVLFPSRHEGFGLPVLEASLHRAPIFFPDLDPLSGLLPGAGSAYPPDASPAEIAELIMQQIDASAAIQARKSLLRLYSWRSIYVNFLAPLLARAHNSPAP